MIPNKHIKKARTWWNDLEQSLRINYWVKYNVDKSINTDNQILEIYKKEK